jgi:hypothetical protein
MVECFRRYMEHGGHSVSRVEYIANLDGKMTDPTFREDILPLLSTDTTYDPNVAHRMVFDRILALL